MGWPVMHSRSPALHNYFFKQYGLTGTYVPLAIPPEGLEPALRALAPLGFAGCNLTIPHKERALAIVDEVDDAARRIGAISCVASKRPPANSLFMSISFAMAVQTSATTASMLPLIAFEYGQVRWAASMI